MTCKRDYRCNLCHGNVGDDGGVGILWGARDEIKAIYFARSEHHLCDACLKGLRHMFSDLDNTTEMFRHLDSLGREPS